MICKICSNSFEKTTNKKYCSKQCVAVANNTAYKRRLKEKPCKYCNSIFVGSRLQVICQSCKNTEIKRNFAEIVCSIQCRKCGTVVDSKIKKLTKTNIIDNNVICDDCKKQTSIWRSLHMKQHNPMFKKDVVEKSQRTLKNKFENDTEYREKVISHMRFLGKTYRTVMTEEQRLLASYRMKTDNPMRNTDIKQKNIETRKRNGQRNPTGKEHRNWKGNRDRAQTIRTRLYKPWIYPILERSSFCCELCNATKTRLEVHHDSMSFAECLSKCLDGRILETLTDEEFEDIIQRMIAEHKTITGITVCVSCHRTIDKKRH